jgi:gamma-glutamyl:cysteine ligase YbdK (ATP-grasp superfamily)
MKVNRPGSPLSSGAEPLDPLDPKELQEAVKGERFAAALSQLDAQTTGGAGGPANPTRTALEEIAQGADLLTAEGAATAVRESARLMIRSRLHEKFRQSEQGSTLVEKLSEFVASDPLLNAKLLGILQRLKSA